MKIVSLIPSATEIVFALGLGDSLDGVTFECDYPPEAKSKAVVSGTALHTDEPLTAKEIDDAVSQRVADGEAIYTLDAERIRDIQPDLILAQDLCQVCAVPSGAVEEALEVLGCRADVISLDPSTLDEVIDCIAVVGEATDTMPRARGAHPRAARTCRHRARCGRAAPPAAHVRARVVRPAVQRWPLGAGHDRSRRRRLRARVERGTIPSSRLGRGGSRRPGRGRVHAVRLHIRAGRRGRTSPASTCPHSRVPSTSSRRMRTRSSPARGPAWSTDVEVLAWALHPRAFPAPPPGLITGARAEPRRASSGCRSRR